MLLPAGRIADLGRIFPYIGSKRWLVPTFLRIMPPHRKYVELFGGSAAIMLSKPVPPEGNVYNDLDPHLVGFHRNFSCKALERCKRVRNVCKFAEGAIRRVAKGSSDVCDQIAARRFSIVSAGRSLKKDECKVRPVVPKTLERRCGEYEAILKRTRFENLDFRKAFEKHDAPGVLTYADPPYPKTAQPYRPQAKERVQVDPRSVCDLARKAKGFVLISYNDLPEIREACKGLYIKSIPVRYRSMRVNRGKNVPESRELLISNFRLPL